MATAEIRMTDICRAAELKDGVDDAKPAANTELEEGKCKKLKKPRRILHFSDGILEEYSTDDEEEEEKKKPDSMSLMDPKSLHWGPWMYYWMLYSGSSALSACDYIGEGLANMLGITSPKYQYEIDEFHRCEEEEKAEKEEEEAQMAGWRSSDQTIPAEDVSTNVLNSPPLPPSQAATDVTQTQVTTESEVEQTSIPEANSTPAHDSTKWDRF